MISVATGGASAEQADDDYRARHEKLTDALRRIGQPNPFPWPSLWEWHTFYARRLGTHEDRRRYVDRLAQKVLVELPPQDTLQARSAAPQTWQAVNLRLDELQDCLKKARTLDDYQDVGRRCREVMIAAANTLFSDSMVSAGEVVPHGSNAKDRMDIVLRNSRSRPELRRLLRDLTLAAWDLSVTVLHSDSASKLDAIIAADSTTLLARSLKQLQIRSPSA